MWDSRVEMLSIPTFIALKQQKVNANACIIIFFLYLCALLCHGGAKD
jgi:hypothetical protein